MKQTIYLAVRRCTTALAALTLCTGIAVDAGAQSIELNLADMVGGGNGTGNGTPQQGINQNSGSVVGNCAFANNSQPKNVYHAVPSSLFIDGVFVPNGAQGNPVISSTGLTALGVPFTVSPSWDYIVYSNPSPGPSNCSNSGYYPYDPAGFYRDTEFRFHANNGITFDIDAIEVANSGYEATSFSAVVGNTRNTSLEFRVYVDGGQAAAVIGFSNAASAPITIPLNPADRFLTILVTDVNGYGADQSVVGDPILTLSPQVVDTDSDSIPDDADNCPFVANLGQDDFDGDGVGDACDDDKDGDDQSPPEDCNDLDPTIFIGQVEICADGIDNDCDALIDDNDPEADCDGDGFQNELDNCPEDPNPGQVDTDMDGDGDVCDLDDDGDGTPDEDDNCPLVANDQADFDGDGVGDACDGDRDQDGVLNADDYCPSTAASDMDAGVPDRRLGKNRWADLDGDGEFDTAGKNPTSRQFTIQDTGGCGCAQIIEVCGYGKGHTKFGCSNSVMDSWTNLYDSEGGAEYQCKAD